MERNANIPDRVNDRGEAFVVGQAGKRSLVDLVRILDSAPKPDPEYWNIVEEITRK
jgi:hypothetical protein